MVDPSQPRLQGIQVPCRAFVAALSHACGDVDRVNRSVAFALVLAACSGAPPRVDPAAPPPGRGRVVVISIDGLMPDAYLDPDGHGLAVPTLRSLVARGAAARVHGVMPTVTY